MQGGLDPRQPYEFYEHAGRYIPNSPSVQVRIIDAGHFFQVEAPDQTNKAIRDLLDLPVN